MSHLIIPGSPSQSRRSLRMIRVAFAPDFRDVVPYEHLLADALSKLGIKIDFLKGYRRVLPLYRALGGVSVDILHLHFPQYYLIKGDQFDLWRKLRFCPELYLTTRNLRVVYTVHDLYPLNYPDDFLTRVATRYLFSQCSTVLVHAAAAKERVIKEFRVSPEKCIVIPHGDMSVSYGLPTSREKARAQLGLGPEKVCLAFGTIAPNKAIEEIIDFWKAERPAATLAIVGRSLDPAYTRELSKLAADSGNVVLKPHFQSDEQVNFWFSAADCAIINYRKIFTSGVACLARSLGLPLLLPARLTTVDLQEPHRLVYRFDSMKTDFAEKLERAIQQKSDYAAAEEWRRATAWEVVAARTREAYEIAMRQA
jgi:beta-1,4-mannosyltransferase